MYATPALPEGKFPGDAKVTQLSQSLCQAAPGLPSGATNFVYAAPTETQWNLGQHKVYCLYKA
ncbi:hypothetical protein [Fodinicola feengrottensis]|uniref:hypothetical protein n=1 Tax=Fodinicola feengrottensis TaxID=435914 RepID=UPI0013D6305A|nr:hypothetical protein [Fodinicola feengrottensis]